MVDVLGVVIHHGVRPLRIVGVQLGRVVLDHRHGHARRPVREQHGNIRTLVWFDLV